MVVPLEKTIEDELLGPIKYARIGSDQTRAVHGMRKVTLGLSFDAIQVDLILFEEKQQDDEELNYGEANKWLETSPTLQGKRQLLVCT